MPIKETTVSPEQSPLDTDGYFECFWPRAERRQTRKALAARLDTLAGKTVAFVWDYVFRGDEVFAILQEALSARFAGIRFIPWSEFGNTHGRDERKIVAGLPDRMKALRVDAVVSGMAC
jgi:hypothetical protein